MKFETTEQAKKDTWGNIFADMRKKAMSNTAARAQLEKHVREIWKNREKVQR